LQSVFEVATNITFLHGKHYHLQVLYVMQYLVSENIGCMC